MSTTIPFQPGEVRRILVCQLRQIGDVLLTTPAIELLSRRFPEAQIHFFTEKKCLPMVQNNPHIHTLWPVDKKAMPTLWHEIRYYKKVAAQGFDLVIDFQQLPRIRWVVLFSGARCRLTYTPPWYLRPLYTHWADYGPGYAAEHKAQILAPLGITWNGEPPRLFPTDDERRQAAELFGEIGITGAERLVSIDATHRHDTRRWPAQHFAALMDMAADADDSLHFLLPFGPGEQGYAEDLRHMCRRKDKVHIPPRMLCLSTLPACIERAAMHFGNCSSPRHMAVAVDTPSLTILGSTGDSWTFPSPKHIHIHSSIACRPCQKNTCSDHLRCLTELLPEQVFPVFMKHLNTHGCR